MRRKAIRCLLILSFLTIFGLVFYVESTYSQELAGNKTKVEKLEGKVENLSKLYEQNRIFHETLFHQQNNFLLVIVTVLGTILLVLVGTQTLFSFKISKDIIDRAVDKAKEGMIKTIGDTRTKLETDIENNKTKFSELEKKTIEQTNELTGLVCHNEGVYHYQVGDFPYAIKRLEEAIDSTKKTSNKKASIFWIARSLQKSDSAHYPENFRKRVKEKPEIYSGLEKEVEKAIEGAV